MIVREHYKTRADGVKLFRTYSADGMRLIRNDGVMYDEAVDVEGSDYTYIESLEYVQTVEPDA